VAREGRPKHQDQIDIVVGERRGRTLMVEHLHLEAHIGIARPIGRDGARQELEGDRLAARDAHRPAA
jgi:hypothetical protein